MSTDPQSTEWYNQKAALYTEHVRNPDESVYHSLYEKPAMYKLLPDLNGKSAISLGCGPGEDCHYLQTHGAEKVVGIDLSEKLIDIAKDSYPECEFQVMDMEKLDFPDNSFDLAYSSLAIHYVKDWRNVFSEVYRILKPNSSFIFSCNHPVASSFDVIQDDEIKRVMEFSRVRDKVTDEVSIVGNYVGKRAIKGYTDMPVTTWRMPFGDIATEATDEGFLISNICEPIPHKRMKDLYPVDYETLSKIPFFIIFKLLKP